MSLKRLVFGRVLQKCSFPNLLSKAAYCIIFNHFNVELRLHCLGYNNLKCIYISVWMFVNVYFMDWYLSICSENCSEVNAIRPCQGWLCKVDGIKPYTEQTLTQVLQCYIALLSRYELSNGWHQELITPRNSQVTGAQVPTCLKFTADKLDSYSEIVFVLCQIWCKIYFCNWPLLKIQELSQQFWRNQI